MKVLDTFAGIGGFSFASHKRGWETVAFIEKDKECHKVLRKQFPNVPIYDDVTTFDGTSFQGAIDIITGGWPCQDNSNANQSSTRRSGLDGERSGLFTHFARIIREVRPRYVVAENTPDILVANGGRDFNRILSELASMGFDAEWGVLRASDIGSPHHRARLYLVAYTRREHFQTIHLSQRWRDVRAQTHARSRVLVGTTVSVGGAWRPVPDVYRMADGVSAELHRPSALIRHRLLGNSIVPQIAEHLFNFIQLREDMFK